VAIITLLPTENVYVAEWYPTTNFISKDMLCASQYQQIGDDYRSLLKFNLYHIPPASTIVKAELEVFMYRNEVEDYIMLNVHQILNRWSDKTVTWNSQPYYKEEAESSIPIYHDSPSGPQYIDLTNLVKGWCDGSIPNNGILLKGNEYYNNLVAFRSHNYYDSREWPKLIITFVDGILNTFSQEELQVPVLPNVPIVTSNPIPLGPRKQATFLIRNLSDSPDLKVRIQVGYDNSDHATFFDTDSSVQLKRNRYPGEAVALSTCAAAEYARVLIIGSGGEKVVIYARTKEY